MPSGGPSAAQAAHQQTRHGPTDCARLRQRASTPSPRALAHRRPARWPTVAPLPLRPARCYSYVMTVAHVRLSSHAAPSFCQQAAVQDGGATPPPAWSPLFIRSARPAS